MEPALGLAVESEVGIIHPTWQGGLRTLRRPGVTEEPLSEMTHDCRHVCLIDCRRLLTLVWLATAYERASLRLA